MSNERCPHEDAIVEAARGGEWNAELVSHRDECPACAQLCLVATVLKADAEAFGESAPPPPDPSLIWLRARLAARERQVERATRSIALVQKAAIACAAAVVLTFAPAAWRMTTGVLSKADLALPTFPNADGFPIPVLVGSLAVLGILALAELTSLRES